MDGKPFSTAYYPSPGEQEASDLQNIKLIVISVSNKNMRKAIKNSEFLTKTQTGFISPLPLL